MLWPSNREIAGIWQFTGSHRGSKRSLNQISQSKVPSSCCRLWTQFRRKPFEFLYLWFCGTGNMIFAQWTLPTCSDLSILILCLQSLHLPKCQQYEWTLVNFCSFGFALLNVQCSSSMCKRTFVKSANLGWTFGQPMHLVLTPLFFFSARAFGYGSSVTGTFGRSIEPISIWPSVKHI